MTLLGDRCRNIGETRRNPRLPNTGSPGTVCFPISHIPPRDQSFRQFVLKRFSNHFQKDLRALAVKERTEVRPIPSTAKGPAGSYQRGLWERQIEIAIRRPLPPLLP